MTSTIPITYKYVKLPRPSNAPTSISINELSLRFLISNVNRNIKLVSFIIVPLPNYCLSLPFALLTISPSIDTIYAILSIYTFKP